MKLTRFKVKLSTNGKTEIYKVYKTKEVGLLVEMNGAYVPLNTLKEIDETCVLVKKKQHIRDNSFLDWARSIFSAIGIIAIVTLPSAVIAVI